MRCEYKQQLEKSVHNWGGKEWSALDCNGEPIINFSIFCNILHITYHTSNGYVTIKKEHKVIHNVVKPKNILNTEDL